MQDDIHRLMYQQLGNTNGLNQQRLHQLIAEHLKTTTAYTNRKPTPRRPGPRRLPTLHRLIARDGTNCYLCHQPLTLEQMVLEHIIPASQGGTHHDHNLAIACAPCNYDKQDHYVSQTVDADRLPCYSR